jgi:hypothetical protein
MLRPDIAREIVDMAGRGALLGLIGSGLVVAGTRMSGRAVPRPVALVTFGFLGLLIGTTIVGSAGQPIVRAPLLVGLLTVFMLSVQVRHQDWGGIALIGAGLPAAVVGLADFLDANARFGLSGAYQDLPMLAIGLLTSLSGAMFVDGSAVSAQKLAGPSGERPWNAASTVVVGRAWFGLNRASWVSAAGSTAVVLVAVGLASGRGPVETIVAVFVGGMASSLVASLLWAVAWPATERIAFEGFAWVGEIELRRIRDLAGPISLTKDGMVRFIRNTTERPEDRWFRAEILAIDGQLERAREVAEQIPLDTLLAPVDRAANLAYIDWLQGGPGDTADLRFAVSRLPAGSDERLIGEGTVALMQTRQLVASHDEDAAAPFRAFRLLVGSRADRQLWVTTRRGLPGQFQVAVAMIVLLTVADHALVG